MLKQLLAKRGRLSGDRRLTEEWVKSNTGFKSIEELAQAVHSGKVKLKEIQGLRPFFRLSPPSKGYKSLKRPVGDFGDLGYRGEKINELLKRMV
jgi:large subunit ribosomal protein L30